MRSATAQELVQLASKSRSTHVRVKIDRGGGDWVDMTTYYGVNWVSKVEWAEDVDNPVAEATVGFARSADYRTLAPFVDGSELNQLGTIVDVGNAIVIDAAVMPEGVTPQAADWKEMFRGEIEDIDWTHSPIEAKCLDQGAWLQSAWIETQQKYPVDPATSDDVQDIMQSILNDYGGSVVLWSPNGTGAPAFNPADSPGWVVTEYWQKKQPVLDALRELAGMIGWELRYQWQTTATAFKLQLFEPDRAVVGHVHHFSANDYYEITRCGLSRANIRNAIRGVIVDSTNVHTSVLRTNPASIAKYGRRFMEIVEASTSAIDTAAELTTMIDNIILDLCEPAMDNEARLPFFWPAMLGDVYNYAANGVHYDTDQDLAVVGIRHRFAGGKGETTLTHRGKPSGGSKRWLALEARMGVAPSSDLLPKEAPTNVTGLPGAGSVTITFDDPRTMSPPVTDWAYTEVYVDDANPCVVNGAHLQGKGRQTRFDVVGLVPGTTYYSVCRHIDGSGNVGATSAQVTVAAERVATYHTDNDSKRVSMVPNADFGHQTKNVVSFAPDGWSMFAGSWGSASDAYVSTATVLSAKQSFLFRNTATATVKVRSALFPVEGGDLLTTSLIEQHDVNNGANGLTGTIYWFKEDKTTASATASTVFWTSGLSAAGLNVWKKSSSYYLRVPTDARYALVELYKFTAAAVNVYVDSVKVTTGLASFAAYSTGMLNITAGSYQLMVFNAEHFDNGAVYNPGAANYRYTAAVDGLHAFSAWATVTGFAAGKLVKLALFKNGAVVKEGPETECTAAMLTAGRDPRAVVDMAAMDLVAGDYVDVRIYHDGAGTEDLVLNNDKTGFRGIQTTRED